MFTLALIIWTFKVTDRPHPMVLLLCWMSDVAIILAGANLIIAGLDYWINVLVPAINYATGN